MKSFSSALFIALAALTTSLPFAAQAQTQEARDKIQLADNAPDSYTVVKGDTLWGISSKFLKSPWRWPEVWKLNNDQIKNPHWIYPGQVIYLDRTNMTLSLTPPVSSGSEPGFVKLSPKVYSTDAGGPISSVPLTGIQQFLAEPLVTDSPNPENAGTVVAIQENRVLAGNSETFFARNLLGNQTTWSVFRPGSAIKDPIDGRVLGYEAILAANAQVTTPEQPPQAAALRATTVKHEITVGDRLLPLAKESTFAYVPREAPRALMANVASIYGGLDETGPNGIITINAGLDKGIEPGHVAALYRVLGNATYRATSGSRAEQIPLPDERYGLIFIFRVFNKMSYALVLESTRPVRIGDKALAP